MSLLALIFDKLYAELQKASISQRDRFKILSTYYITYAISDDQILQLVSWLEGKDTALKAKPVADNELRWMIVKKAFSTYSLSNE